MHICASLIAIYFAVQSIAEKIFVSYIKIYNSTTSPKTLQKKNTFVLLEVNEIIDV